MPPQTQSDPVEQFQSLPPDKQREMFEKLSPAARTGLVAKVKAKVEAKKAKTAQAGKDPFELATGHDPKAVTAFYDPKETKYAAREVATGVGEAIKGAAKMGLHALELPVNAKPLAEDVRELLKPLKDIGQVPGAIKELGQSGYALPALEMQLPRVLGQALGAEIAGKVTTGGIKAVTDLAEKGVPASLTKAATKPIIQKHLFDRAQKVQGQIQTAADNFHAEVGQRWQHLEKTIDQAKPEGSIDIGGLKTEAQSAVKEAIKVPQKLPETVKTLSKGSEPIKLRGSIEGTLDPSTPAYKEIYERLQSAGVIPKEREVITFAEARQLRSKLGRELHSGTLSGEATSVGWKVYGDLTDAMSKSAAEHNMAGAFADANRLHAQYMEDFVNRKSPLTKAIRGNNPHEIMGPLSDPKYAEQARRIMAKYQKHGLTASDMKAINAEGQIFQKLKSGLPEQFRFNRWEMAADLAGVGVPYTGVRALYNWGKRAGAISSVEKPIEFSERPRVPTGTPAMEESNVEMERRGAQPPTPPRPSSNTPEGAARHAQALKQASEELKGGNHSVRDLLKRADEIERGMQ